MGKKIVLDYDKFKEFIESIEDTYTKYYRGDWDWKRYTTFEVKDGYVLKKNRYSDNGIKPPDDSDEKILPFRFFDQQIRCEWYRCYKDRGTICVCENKEALKEAGVSGGQGIVDREDRDNCLGKVVIPECKHYEPKK